MMSNNPNTENYYTNFDTNIAYEALKQEVMKYE